MAATPQALWPLVSDTNRFNRDAGVPAVEEPSESASGTRRLRLKRYGVTIEWDEEPFEWIRPRQFGVLRRYHAGPVREMLVQAELLPAGEHETLLRYSVTATARNPLGYVAIPFEIGLLSARRFGAVFRNYAELARQAPVAAVQSRYQLQLLPYDARLTNGGSERMASALATLRSRGVANELVLRVRELIERGDDLTAARIQPYVLAAVWNVPRRSAVELCLQATRVGLLDLQWDLLCPLCRGAKDTRASLRELPGNVHCTSCHVDFEADFEQSVELSFRTNSSIRHVDVFPFCVGGPQVTPHIVAQQTLRPHENRELQLYLEAGGYRIRCPAVGGVEQFHVEADADRAVRLSNPSEAARLYIIERTEWSDYALTAAEVTALQEFRDLFASEALRPGETINVGCMTILFTDLRDSTRMYQEIGDAPAFGRVLNHFDVLRAALLQEEGALVKTIGDAVMAVFRSPASALRTILRAQELLAAFPDGVRGQNLKAGAHFGPCIGVTLNERLDYFGSTVNIAARLGALSRGGEIIISQAVADDPEVRLLLNEPTIEAQQFEAQLKGFEGQSLQLLRVARRQAEKMLASGAATN